MCRCNKQIYTNSENDKNENQLTTMEIKYLIYIYIHNHNVFFRFTYPAGYSA